MIGRIDIEKTLRLQPNAECLFVSVATVLNHVVDAVNAIQKEREAERFEIQEWIGILEAVRKSVNIHEKQIDELQMKIEPEKCETPAETVQQVSHIAPGDTTVFHGFNCSVEFDTPLPKGTIITIKSITKGGDNE